MPLFRFQSWHCIWFPATHLGLTLCVAPRNSYPLLIDLCPEDEHGTPLEITTNSLCSYLAVCNLHRCCLGQLIYYDNIMPTCESFSAFILALDLLENWLGSQEALCHAYWVCNFELLSWDSRRLEVNLDLINRLKWGSLVWAASVEGLWTHVDIQFRSLSKTLLGQSLYWEADSRSAS
jgi:hypothetical protein